MRTFRRMGDANIPGYNRALVAPTGFPSDPFPFLNNKWLQLSRAKVNYAVNYHPVLGPQLVAQGTGIAGLGRASPMRRRMSGLGAPRIYNPFARRPQIRRGGRMRGLGDIQPYGINADGTPVFIDPADGTVYDSNGNVMSDLSQVNSTAAGQFAATQVVGTQVSSIQDQLSAAFPFFSASALPVVPPSLNVGPLNQVYATAGPGGFQANVPQQQRPPQQPSWWSKASGLSSFTNGQVVLGGGLIAVALGMVGSRRK